MWGILVIPSSVIWNLSSWMQRVSGASVRAVTTPCSWRQRFTSSWRLKARTSLMAGNCSNKVWKCLQWSVTSMALLVCTRFSHARWNLGDSRLPTRNARNSAASCCLSSPFQARNKRWYQGKSWKLIVWDAWCMKDKTSWECIPKSVNEKVVLDHCVQNKVMMTELA